MISLTRSSFRFKAFLAVFGVAAVAVLVATVLASQSLRRQTYERIERSLVAEARLAAELLAHHAPGGISDELDREAKTLGGDIVARVTLIAADGRVVGDSAVDLADLHRLENHGTRPEVAAARQKGLGIERRYSATLKIDMLYVAAPVRHPSIAFVRLALPLTDIDEQLRAVRNTTFVALVVALLSALGLAWISSRYLGRRLDAIASVARRYATGDMSQRVRDYGEDELGTVARVLDESVSELGRRVAELDQHRARMEALFAGMVEGVVVIDGDGTMQLANEAARRMLRIEPSAIGRHYLEAVRHPDIAAQLASALKGETRDSLEVLLGRDRTFVARAAPARMSTGSGAVLVLHDITDLRRADQVQRDFVANVSHELRTPLTAIHGYIEALLDDAADPAERHRFLEIIARHTARMERLVRDLLRLARLEAGEEPIENSACAIDAVFDGLVAELQPMLDAKRQQVQTRMDPGLRQVFTDPGKLHDALSNLVENAMKYSPEGGIIMMKASEGDNHLVLTVSDEGPGIPEADLVRIFERFYRLEKARTRASGGTGLGLSIAKHLAARLGGDIEAANRAGGGAIFTLSLPLRLATPHGKTPTK